MREMQTWENRESEGEREREKRRNLETKGAQYQRNRERARREIERKEKNWKRRVCNNGTMLWQGSIFSKNLTLDRRICFDSL